MFYLRLLQVAPCKGLFRQAAVQLFLIDDLALEKFLTAVAQVIGQLERCFGPFQCRLEGRDIDLGNELAFFYSVPFTEPDPFNSAACIRRRKDILPRLGSTGQYEDILNGDRSDFHNGNLNGPGLIVIAFRLGVGL